MSDTTATSIPPEFPDEVVTHAHTRAIDLPLEAGRAALVTLDNGHDHRKPNTLGPASLQALDAALDEAFAIQDVQAVCVTGKPFILAAGADLKGVELISRHEQALSVAQLGHRVLRRLGEAPVPTFAFINGLALGGGLEIALNCTYRTVSSSVTGVALPEAFIGLVPGWGGAYLLPRLVGPERAIRVVIENALNQNRMLKGPQVAELGIADVELEPADFLEQSIRWAASVLTAQVEVQRHEVDLRDSASWDAAVARGREVADEKVRGAAPAPYRALELVAAARTSERDHAFAAEDQALADMIMSEEFRSSTYAFDLVQRRAKRPAGAPEHELARPVTKVGVVGAGLMATQLATLFVRQLQVPVVLTDLDAERVERGVAGVHAEIARQAGKGRLSRDEANRLTALVSGSTDRSVFADADLVIEDPLQLCEHLLLDGHLLEDRRGSGHRGGLRGDAHQEAGARRVGADRSGPVCAGHQHLLAVRDGDGHRSRPSRTRGRHPLLQPRGRAAVGGGHPRRADRSGEPRHRLRGGQGTEEVVCPGRRCARVRGQPDPAAHDG